MLSWHLVQVHTWHTFFFSVCSGLPHFPWMDWMLEAGKNRDRQTDRQTNTEGESVWGKPALWLRVEVREFPCEMDRFYIWPDWNVAWSSATATRGPHAASPPSVMLTAKIKRILSYSFICNVETAWPATISQGYYSCHVKTPQRQAEIFGFSYLYNSVGGTPCGVFRGFSQFVRHVRIYLGWVETLGPEVSLL